MSHRALERLYVVYHREVAIYASTAVLYRDDGERIYEGEQFRFSLPKSATFAGRERVCDSLLGAKQIIGRHLNKPRPRP